MRARRGWPADPDCAIGVEPADELAGQAASRGEFGRALKNSEVLRGGGGPVAVGCRNVAWLGRLAPRLDDKPHLSPSPEFVETETDFKRL